MTWRATTQNTWQGRDDTAESPDAKRMHQIIQTEQFVNAKPNDIALLGFASDEGVRRNQGRTGAAAAPAAIRKALASLATHGERGWWDGGDVFYANDDTSEDEIIEDLGEDSLTIDSLARTQKQLADLVTAYHQKGLQTLVLGGGHETAYAHGLGLYQAYPDKNIGIINFDAHLDMRQAEQATSGTPFLQLANYCQDNQRDFHYLCVGASKAANTQAVINNANQHYSEIIWDTDCFDVAAVTAHLQCFLEPLDAVYLTIDLDAINAAQMFAVSAPAALGVPLNHLMEWVQVIGKTGKVIGGDVVEYNPALDRDQLCARIAARLIWEMGRF